ncbi:hypothetical protein [Jannaschia seohaensis]|uniref:Uncharacterized protein n=1 Tax=Jannaschia seohaensis TaxID=475081 RepID=A0A2Y9AMK5_9RHOB|nr:hypothetical protein [Jannaschia seohaensis]PWJ20502.1 hypothetical protein BCF38_103320 [Jannaschia seohaensis]SSA44598.1 hypothetical protein SAMN05421539_103320 [Jannaschia seohaensis]
MRASLLLILMGLPAVAQEPPQSVIPWLSDSIASRIPPDGRIVDERTVEQLPDPTIGEPPVTAPTETTITTQPLGTTRRDAVGLISPARSGLPADAVAGSDPARLADLLARQPADALPAMQDLLLTLLLAELNPPRAAADPDALFFARIDTLLRFGALDQAQALLERAGATDRQAFRRWFDTSLLTGFDARACDAMTANPSVAPTLPARIFCLSRTGDWPAAALTLETGRALGRITPAEDELLAHFLDPDLFEGLPPPIPPRPMTPLAFRLLDGIGETPDTRALPLAFAVADLRPTSGWKAQIEAAERLARIQALAPNRLLSLYTERRPAASGGVWDRAAAIQALDAALLAGRPDAVADALPEAIARMEESGLLVPFAELYADPLARMRLPPHAQAHAARIGLLSDDYESTGETHPGSFAAAIARGAPDLVPPRTGLEQAIRDGFTNPPPDRLLRLAADDRLGEALLEAGLLLADGARSDPQGIADALALLRAAGLEETARRTALQLLLT